MAKKKKIKPWTARAAEWLKAHWREWSLLLLGLLMGVSLVIWKSCAPDTGATDAAQAEIESGAAQSDAATQAKIEDLEAELFELREDIATINARIEASIVGREAVHNEIDNANSIERINRVLRDRRITGATNPGTTRETSRPDLSSDGVDANPYR